MNHFLLSTDPIDAKGEKLEKEGLYGINAMDMLLNKMIDQGAKRLNIRSKIYGGATILLNVNQKMFKDIGSDNSNFAVKYLNKYNIPIIESDIGERKSLKIYFDSEDYSVFVQKI